MMPISQVQQLILGASAAGLSLVVLGVNTAVFVARKRRKQQPTVAVKEKEVRTGQNTKVSSSVSLFPPSLRLACQENQDGGVVWCVGSR